MEVSLRIISGDEPKEACFNTGVYKTDYFEILFFKSAGGYLLLNQQKVTIANSTFVFISPFPKRQWKLDPPQLDFTFLIFQEDFLNDFFSDQLFTYCLLFFYQLNYPMNRVVTKEEMQKACGTLTEINGEQQQNTLCIIVRLSFVWPLHCTPPFVCIGGDEHLYTQGHILLVTITQQKRNLLVKQDAQIAGVIQINTSHPDPYFHRDPFYIPMVSYRAQPACCRMVTVN